ncbi:hypothetical protein [Hymenobacter mucosus]|uniref:Right handed beta helix region n=1 Tax=Hymenobacter mucosus TaxID=1411120 RepID=A0A238WW90_9BACT|nr:hypothetical protein [Hymenobacter mucosus]SNR50713.1 hypothetical protein SAMN06269173_103175 [Hymenobacter mucosus]
MRFLLPLLLFFSALALLPGCEPKEDIITTDSSAKLEFSADTVKFDTVFVTVGTVTKRLWVYNRNPRAVRVEEISLTGRPGVTYNLLINGDAGSTANNVEIRGKDSLLVLVSATVDPTAGDARPFIVEDDLRFRTNGNNQQVKVLSYGQNAYFHAAETLPCNAVWTADKPHVIYDYARVGPNCTLTIEPGTRIYSHSGAFLVVQGRLLINPTYAPTGELKPDDKNIVRFQGDRLEEVYNEVPSQWGGIEFDQGSRNNVVRYTEIKNSAFGLLAYNPNNTQPRPNILVENTVLKNISSAKLAFANGGLSLEGAGILGISADFTVHNTLLTNCGEYAVWAVQGGTYRFDYCTIANYTPQFRRESSSVLLASTIKINGVTQPAVAPSFIMRNSIVWGSIEDELAFIDGEQYPSNINISHSLLRTKDYAKGGALDQSKNGNILNPSESSRSIFRSTPFRFRGKGYDYQLDTLSPASNQGVPLPTTIDLLNRRRNANNPDVGAYERVNP